MIASDLTGLDSDHLIALLFLELNQIMNKNPAKIFEAIKKSDEAKEILTKKPDPNAFIPRWVSKKAILTFMTIVLSNSDLFQLVKRDEIEREEYKKMLEEEQKKIAEAQFNMIQTQMTAHIERFNLRVSKS